MYVLDNANLAVAILDPVADRERFGPRYCTGGYILQVEDARHGPLLTGPTYPDSFNWFDGQGIPDSFAQNPLFDPAATNRNALIVGIGECDLVARTVVAYCDWAVERSSDSVTMSSSHAFGPHAVRIERTVRLDARTVRSSTRVVNEGKGLLPIRWFPHPFYPHPDSDDLIRLSFPVRLAAGNGTVPGTGYRIGPTGFIRRVGWPWSDGYFMPLEHDSRAPATIVQRHPVLGLVSGVTSYTPAFFPIWGNSRTFSWEPYLEETIGAGGKLAWWVDYVF